MKGGIKLPLVSVVILNFNGLKYLKRTISPLLKLDYSNYEIIVVDNNSEDGSIQFLEKFKKIRVIKNKKNFGYSKGKNIGVKEARGQYVFLIDNDIWVKNKKILKKLVVAVYPETFISPVIVDIDNKKTRRYGGYYSFCGLRQNKPIDVFKIRSYPFGLINTACPHGGAIFFRKRDFEKIGGYDEIQPFNLDDFDLGCRIWNMGMQATVAPQIDVIHLGTESRKNLKSWCWKYQYYFSGIMRTMIKNYRPANLFISIPFFLVFVSFKTIKNLISRRSFLPIASFFFSVGFFLKNLLDTLRQRKILQSKRIVKDDIFLKIKPPKFD